MTTNNPDPPPPAVPPPPSPNLEERAGMGPDRDWRLRRRWLVFAAAVLGITILTFAAIALLVSIFTRKQEARQPFVRLVEVDEVTTDPVPWGVNWPFHFDTYRRTVDVTQTRYGGSSAMPEQKLETEPWLRTMYSGYAFALDYRERRGHAYMLYDQEHTERVTKKPQSGACLHCHASVVPTYRRLGLEAMGQSVTPALLAADFNWPAVMRGFEVARTMNYAEAHAELLKTPDGTPGENVPLMPGGSSTQQPTPANVPVLPPEPAAPASVKPGAPPTTRQVLAQQPGEGHPVSCIDCHDPATMAIRVTRPGFVEGIRALAESDAPVPHLPGVTRWREGGRREPYDPNLHATRQEMRSFVCAQCHVEYYCGPRTKLVFPWARGLKVEQIEETYDNMKFTDGEPFFDWVHGITGGKVYKAQHPEFELWSQGVHARAGIACADCHMPYTRQGAAKVSDHWVRSPLLNINNACQVCHNVDEDELLDRAQTIQGRTHALMNRAAVAMTDMVEAIARAKASGATAEQLAPLYQLQRSAQWRLDFISSENSMGFHADQEAARVLGESIDFSRQAVAAALRLPLKQPAPTTLPAAEPVHGVTPTENAPPGPYKLRERQNLNTITAPPAPPW